MRTQQMRVQLDCFLEKARPFFKTLLLNANRAEDGIADGLRLWIRQSKPRLLLCLVEAPLLHQRSGLLQRLTLRVSP